MTAGDDDDDDDEWYVRRGLVWRSCSRECEGDVRRYRMMVIVVECFLLGARRAGGKVDCCVSFSCGSIILSHGGRKGGCILKVDCCLSFSCGSIIFIAWGQGEGVY